MEAAVAVVQGAGWQWWRSCYGWSWGRRRRMRGWCGGGFEGGGWRWWRRVRCGRCWMRRVRCRGCSRCQRCRAGCEVCRPSLGEQPYAIPRVGPEPRRTVCNPADLWVDRDERGEVHSMLICHGLACVAWHREDGLSAVRWESLIPSSVDW